MQKYKIQWTYQATYVQGYHLHNTSTQAIINLGPQNDAISFKPPQVRALLHEEILNGAILNSACLALEKSRYCSKIVVIIDNVDEPILLNVRKCISNLTTLNSTPKTKKISGFDKKNKKVVYSTITTQINGLEAYQINFPEIEITANSEDQFILLADVISNAAWYFLKNNCHHPVILASKNNFIGFELYDLLYAEENPTSYARMYQYPVEEND